MTHSLSFQTRVLKTSYISKSTSVRKKVKRPTRGGRVGLGGHVYNDRNGIIDRTGFQLTYAYIGSPFSFSGNVSIGQAEYDDDNPIFNKDQEDDRYGIQGTLYYKNPWNWGLFGSKPMNFYIGGAYTKVDSNIDFYTQEAIMTSVGVFFKW